MDCPVALRIRTQTNGKGSFGVGESKDCPGTIIARYLCISVIYFVSHTTVHQEDEIVVEIDLVLSCLCIAGR